MEEGLETEELEGTWISHHGVLLEGLQIKQSQHLCDFLFQESQEDIQSHLLETESKHRAKSKVLLFFLLFLPFFCIWIQGKDRYAGLVKKL